MDIPIYTDWNIHLQTSEKPIHTSWKNTTPYIKRRKKEMNKIEEERVERGKASLSE
jgi:hypothetical protein